MVFDKGRSPGGRLASRRVEGFAFDLGAQYFTALDPGFGVRVRSWLAEGVVAPWKSRIGAIARVGDAPVEVAPVERFVGTPSMSEVARHLAKELVVRSSHRVDLIERRGSALVLHGTVAPPGTTLAPRAHAADEALEELGAFDTLLVCLPPAQARDLLAPIGEALGAALGRVELEPCFALGLGARESESESEALAAFPFDGLFVGREGDPGRLLSWIARDASKPGRPAGEAWVLHAAPEWSRAHLEAPRDEVERAMVAELARVVGAPIAATTTVLQRWVHALARTPLEAAELFDAELRVGVGGDWAATGRVEGAFLSGVSLARRALEIG